MVNSRFFRLRFPQSGGRNGSHFPPILQSFLQIDDHLAFESTVLHSLFSCEYMLVSEIVEELRVAIELGIVSRIVSNRLRNFRR